VSITCSKQSSVAAVLQSELFARRPLDNWILTTATEMAQTSGLSSISSEPVRMMTPVVSVFILAERKPLFSRLQIVKESTFTLRTCGPSAICIDWPTSFQHISVNGSSSCTGSVLAIHWQTHSSDCYRKRALQVPPTFCSRTGGLVEGPRAFLTGASMESRMRAGRRRDARSQLAAPMRPEARRNHAAGGLTVRLDPAAMLMGMSSA
jgi:hypothetical protein